MDGIKIFEGNGFVIYKSEDNPEELSARIKPNVDFDIEVPAEYEGKKITSFNIYTIISKELKTIFLPATIKNINFAFATIETSYGFSIRIDQKNPWLASDDKAVFTKDMSKIVLFTARDDDSYELPKSVRVIGKYAFMSTRNLKNILLHEGLEEIEECAFFCSGLEKVILPDSVKIIGENAFDQSELSEISLSENLEIIEESAFQSVKYVKELYFHSALREIGKAALPEMVGTFRGVGNNNFFAVRDGILYTKDMQTLIRASQNVGEKAIIPDGVKTIDRGAFAGIRNLKEVRLPASVHTIALKAFDYCFDLEKINLENVKSINYPFSKTAIKNISLTCEEIGERTFEGITSLESVELKNTKIIERYAFSNTGVKRVVLPKSIVEIGKQAFEAEIVEVYDTSPALWSASCNFSGEDHTLLVRSSKTDEIKYAVTVYSSEDLPDMKYSADEIIMKLFDRKTASFNFPLYDFVFNRIYSNINIVGKYMAAHYRLKYPFELSNKARNMYDRYLSEYTKDIIVLMLNNGSSDIKEIMEFPYTDRLSNEELDEILDLSSKLEKTELADWLEKYKNNKAVPQRNDLPEADEESAYDSDENRKRLLQILNGRKAENYLKDAEDGSKVSQYIVGMHYEYGIGFPTNEEKAAEWYTKSAEQDYESAQYALAMCYMYGTGVERNYNKAIELLEKAIKHGSYEAKDKLEALYDEVERDDSLDNEEKRIILAKRK